MVKDSEKNMLRDFKAEQSKGEAKITIADHEVALHKPNTNRYKSQIGIKLPLPAWTQKRQTIIPGVIINDGRVQSSPSIFQVYLVMAAYAMKGRLCYASKSKIAAHCGISRRAVHNAIKVLCLYGYIYFVRTGLELPTSCYWLPTKPGYDAEQECRRMMGLWLGIPQPEWRNIRALPKHRDTMDRAVGCGNHSSKQSSNYAAQLLAALRATYKVAPDEHMERLARHVTRLVPPWVVHKSMIRLFTGDGQVVNNLKIKSYLIGMIACWEADPIRK